MIILYILLNSALVAVVLWGRSETKRFLSSHTAISGISALDDFKCLARRNMIATLIYLPFALVSLLWAIFLSVKLQLAGLALVLVVQGILFLFSHNLKKLEIHTRSLDTCDDASIKDEYQRVCTSWVKKALPDF